MNVQVENSISFASALGASPSQQSCTDSSSMLKTEVPNKTRAGKAQKKRRRKNGAKQTVLQEQEYPPSAPVVTSQSKYDTQHPTVDTTISLPSYPRLKLTLDKSVDRYGRLFRATEVTTGRLFEIRTYFFGAADSKEKQSIKRNCREWKKRRRFLDSFKIDKLVILILQHPQMPFPSSRSPGAESDFGLLSGV